MAEYTQAPRFSISTMKRSNKSLVIQAHLNNRLHTFTIDIGATKSILPKNVFSDSFIQPLVKSPILETATGDRITVHGESQIQLTLGHKVIQATVLVVDIVDDF